MENQKPKPGNKQGQSRLCRFFSGKICKLCDYHRLPFSIGPHLYSDGSSEIFKCSDFRINSYVPCAVPSIFQDQKCPDYKDN